MTMKAATLLHDIADNPDSIAMLKGVLDDLAPLFVSDPEQHEAGRRMALRAVLAHAPANEADFLSAAQVVAHGRTSLALLRDAASPATHPAEKRQLNSQAQQASRTATQIEAAMARRHKRRATAAQPEASWPAAPPCADTPSTTPPPAPVPPVSRDARLQAMMQMAHRIIASESMLGSGASADGTAPEPDGMPPAWQDGWDHRLNAVPT